MFTWLHAQKLKSPDAQVRKAAVERLGAAGPKAADRIMPLVGDPDPAVRLAAVRALAAALPGVAPDLRAQVLTALRPLLGDADPQVQLAVALTLAVETDDGRARNLLLECVHGATAAAEGVLSGASADVSAAVRLDAIRGLGRLTDAATRAVLLATLRDGDASVRGAACEALALVGDARTADVLRRIQASDPDAAVQGKAAAAVREICERRGLEPKVP